MTPNDFHPTKKEPYRGIKDNDSIELVQKKNRNACTWSRQSTRITSSTVIETLTIYRPHCLERHRTETKQTTRLLKMSQMYRNFSPCTIIFSKRMNGFSTITNYLTACSWLMTVFIIHIKSKYREPDITSRDWEAVQPETSKRSWKLLCASGRRAIQLALYMRLIHFSYLFLRSCQYLFGYVSIWICTPLCVHLLSEPS